MKMLVMLMLIIASTANAAGVRGQFFAGSAAGEPSVDRAVLSLAQPLDDGWLLTIAGDGAVAAGKSNLYQASLSGSVLGGTLSLGHQQDMYASLMESRLQTRWVTRPFSNVIADRALYASYSGSFGKINYVAQAADEVKGDHLQGYGLMLSTALFTNLELVVGSRYSEAAKAWTSNAALIGTKGPLTVAVEAAQVAAKGKVNVTTHAVTATYAGVYKAAGLYGQLLNTEELTSVNSSLVGVTYAVNKSVNAAALWSHVDGTDDSAIFRLAASF